MSKPLHILFLCGWYPSRVLPNNGDFIQRHAEAVSLQHKVSVLHIISDENCKNSIEITSQKINNIETYIAYIKPSKNKLVKIFRFWKAYKLLLRKISNFDLVHLNKLYPFGVFALHLKFRKKIPYIISEHWTGYHLVKNERFSKIEKYISTKITVNASFVCPVSNNLKHSMLKLNLAGNYQIVPNVVDTNLFKPTNNSSTQFTITHISSLLDEHKNISGMLRVAKLLEKNIDSFSWNFIGGKMDSYKGLIQELAFEKDCVNFIDHVSHNIIPNYLNSSNVFVLFSNYENLPCVILEAFACGVPVVSTNIGGISEFFPNKFGFLINKNDEDTLLEKITHIYRNPVDLKNEMHQYAIDNFSKQKISNSFSNIYHKSLSK